VENVGSQFLSLRHHPPVEVFSGPVRWGKISNGTRLIRTRLWTAQPVIHSAIPLSFGLVSPKLWTAVD
jgi:hypothetical protein